MGVMYIIMDWIKQITRSIMEKLKLKTQEQKITNYGINNKKIIPKNTTKTKYKYKNKIKTKSKSTNDNKRTCLICGKPAVCFKTGCWRLRGGKADCNKCKERYCEKHWRNIVLKLKLK